jgi:hypothetical protein
MTGSVHWSDQCNLCSTRFNLSNQEKLGARQAVARRLELRHFPRWYVFIKYIQQYEAENGKEEEKR